MPIAFIRAFVAATAAAGFPALAQDAPSTEPEPRQAEPAPEPDAAPHHDVTPLGHVEVVGDGPTPLVLVPFLGCEWVVWKPFMERHTEEFTMYAVSLPGYSGSAPPPQPEDGEYMSVPWVRNAAAAIVHMVRERELDRPVLVGHGAGGSIAMRAGLLEPELFRGVVSVWGYAAMPIGSEGRGRVDPETRRQIISRYKGEGFGRELWKGMSLQAAQRYVRDPERAREIGEHMGSAPLDVARRYFIESIADDFTSELAGLTTPLLAIVPTPPGTPVPHEMIRDYWEQDLGAAPDHEIMLLPDAGSFVMDDRPKLFDRVLAGFIERINEGARGDETSPAESPESDDDGADPPSGDGESADTDAPGEPDASDDDGG